jgi:hypothetical protein
LTDNQSEEGEMEIWTDGYQAGIFLDQLPNGDWEMHPMLQTITAAGLADLGRQLMKRFGPDGTLTFTASEEVFTNIQIALDDDASRFPGSPRVAQLAKNLRNFRIYGAPWPVSPLGYVVDDDVYLP